MRTPSVSTGIAYLGNKRNTRYPRDAVETCFNAEYDGAMKHDIGVLLAASLKDIRLRTTKTQDRWAEKTGMSQSHLSACERGESGWDAIRSIADAVERAGVPAVELLRGALVRAEPNPEDQELLLLWQQLDKISRDSLLTFLRNQVAARSEAR